MQINVRVTANAKQNKIIVNDDVYRVYTNSAPEDGKANEAVIKQLAEYFNIPKSNIKIIRGHTVRTKIVSLLDQVD